MKVRITPKTLLERFNHCSNLKRTGVDTTKEFADFNTNYVFGLAKAIKGNEDKLDRFASHFSIEDRMKFESSMATYQSESVNVKQKAA